MLWREGQPKRGGRNLRKASRTGKLQTTTKEEKKKMFLGEACRICWHPGLSITSVALNELYGHKASRGNVSVPLEVFLKVGKQSHCDLSFLAFFQNNHLKCSVFAKLSKNLVCVYDIRKWALWVWSSTFLYNIPCDACKTALGLLYVLSFLRASLIAYSQPLG